MLLRVLHRFLGFEMFCFEMYFLVSHVDNVEMLFISLDSNIVPGIRRNCRARIIKG